MPLVDDHTSLFRRSWSLYDAIAAENYMFHREIYDQVGRILTERRELGPYSLLDLGCGNARFLAPCLRAAPPIRYAGVDLSAAALDEAGGYLAGIAGVSLHQEEMGEFVARQREDFDLIFTGYAVHHLPATAKSGLLVSCRGVLTDGGGLILVDVLREKGQSREDCVAAYLRLMRGEWTAVPPEMIEEACSHVAAFDDPASFDELEEFATRAGFSEVRMLARHGPHHLLRFST